MRPFQRPDIEEFFRTYAITTFAVSQDERRLAFSTNLNGKYNVWGMDLPNTYPYPLSYQNQPPACLAFDPAGRYILVGFDHDGDENVQLYLLPPDGGAPADLCKAPGRRHFYAGLSEDGNRVYYASDKENHQFLNGYVYDITTDTEIRLYEGAGGASYLLQVAPDETAFVVGVHYANTMMPAYVHQGGQVNSLVPDDTVPHVVQDVVFAGDSILFTTNYQDDRSYLAEYNRTTKALTRLVAVPDADITTVLHHKSSNIVYLVAESGVEDRLYRYDLATADLREMAKPFSVVEMARLAESGTLYTLGRSDVQPFNLYRMAPDGTWTQLTTNRVMGRSVAQLVSAEVLRYPSFDGTEIEALWFPAPPDVAHGYTVVWPHGGPQAAERRAFRPFFQYLLSRGYNVFAPNFRGSTGYGATFVKQVERDWGHGPRLDIMEGVEWLIRQGKADRSKLFLVGGSYGGYMTLLLHGRHPEYWRACVDIFGPSNLFTFLESVPDHWKPAMEQWLGHPEKDRDRLVQDSPITYLEHMTKPMLVIQGANDPRVVQAESDQIVEALRKRGVHVEYLVFPDEGHGFMKKENEMEAYRRAVEFLDKCRDALL